MESGSEKQSRWRFRFSLRILLLVTALVAAYFAFLPPFFKYTPYDSHAELDERFQFLCEEVEIWVVLEDGHSAPTFKQRRLISRLQQYDPILFDAMCDAADQHRQEYQHAVGDLVLEYGLPVMNRENIQEHFGVGLIWIPQLKDLPDDFLF